MSLDPRTFTFGYYTVDEEVFALKIPALMAASRKGVNPVWHYHDHIYRLQDWASPVKRSLNDLYQSRARQLRSKYDYLVLSFSGGSDSYTALDAFRTSGTHLDEIFVRWPRQATENIYCADNTNHHPSNILSEWQLAIQPALEMVAKEMPATQITVKDWSTDLLTTEVKDQDWVETIPQDYLNVGSRLKWTQISPSEREQIDRGRTTCFISGIDKPQLYEENNKIYCYFLDKFANGFYNSVYALTQGRHCEHFYWTPDMPEITVEQAKRLYINLAITPHMRDCIDRTCPFDSAKKNIWNDWTRSIIYPEYYNLGRFQAHKSYTNIRDQVDDWMSIHCNSRYVQSWKWALENLLISVHPRFIQKKGDEPTGFIGFLDGAYYLGDLPPR